MCAYTHAMPTPPGARGAEQVHHCTGRDLNPVVACLTRTSAVFQVIRHMTTPILGYVEAFNDFADRRACHLWLSQYVPTVLPVQVLQSGRPASLRARQPTTCRPLLRPVINIPSCKVHRLD